MTAPPANGRVIPEPVRVLIVDDSATVRGFLCRMLTAEDGVVVAGTAANGREAVEVLRHMSAEVVLLDIEMPVMNGLEALAVLAALRPQPRVIMISSLTQRGAAVTLEALARGASDYVAKPNAVGGFEARDFRHELVAKIKAWGRFAHAGGATEAARAIPPKRLAPDTAPRRAAPKRPSALAVGSSTGGPKALLELFAGLRRPPPCPVFITQHMPPTFTARLAEQIGRAAGFNCVEASEGETARAGWAYVAPGGRHLLVDGGATDIRVRLDDGPPENFCRPSVDAMLRSLVPVYGAGLLVVMLTGMGRDGADGCAVVVERGGAVIAQDEATSVIWGMPGAVARAGLAYAVLPLPEIAPHLNRIFAGERP